MVSAWDTPVLLPDDGNCATRHFSAGRFNDNYTCASEGEVGLKEKLRTDRSERNAVGLFGLAVLRQMDGNRLTGGFLGRENGDG